MWHPCIGVLSAFRFFSLLTVVLHCRKGFHECVHNLCVCMSVCLHVYVYMLVHVCVFVYVHVWMCICTCGRVYVRVCVCVCVHHSLAGMECTPCAGKKEHIVPFPGRIAGRAGKGGRLGETGGGACLALRVTIEAFTCENPPSHIYLTFSFNSLHMIHL